MSPPSRGFGWQSSFPPCQTPADVAHYTELKGAIDAPLLAKAIAEGMMQADTLRMRFAEDHGEVWQWIDEAMLLPEPSIVRVDFHGRRRGAEWRPISAEPARRQRSAAGVPADSSGESHWYWYQRYHHLVVDGFRFPGHYASDRRHFRCVAERGTRARLPVYPFAEVVEEYQRYRDSEAYQRDGACFGRTAQQLPSPVSLSSAPLPGHAATTDILRLKMAIDGRAFSQLAQMAGSAALPIWRLRWWCCGWAA
ncbi:condensation domain-containing protein [Enterobacter hormaechei]